MNRRYPRLRDGVRLVHPEGTDLFFAYCSTGGECYELNEVAYEMVRRMDGGHDVEAICGVIEAAFEGAGDVREDVEALLADLVAQGLALVQPGDTQKQGASNA